MSSSLPLPSALPALPSALPELPSALPELPSALPALPSALPALPSALPELPSALPALPSALPELPSALPALPEPGAWRAALLLGLVAAASGGLGCSRPSRAAEPVAARRPAPRCQVGLALNEIGGFDFNIGTFQAHGMAWMRWHGAWEDCLLWPSNASDGGLDELVRTSEGQDHYRRVRIKGTFLARFNLHRYPFDRQVLEIHLENPTRHTDQLELVAEPAADRGGPAPGLAHDLEIPGWEVTSARTFTTTRIYRSGLGLGAPQSYERIVYRVELRRSYWPYLVKVLVPLSVIVTVVFLGFVLPPQRIDVSVGLVVTCLLATIALHLTQASSMPAVGYLVAGDYAFLVAYVLLSLALTERIVSFHLANRGQENQARRLNRRAVAAFVVTYLTSICLILGYFSR